MLSTVGDGRGAHRRYRPEKQPIGLAGQDDGFTDRPPIAQTHRTDLQEWPTARCRTADLGTILTWRAQPARVRHCRGGPAGGVT